MKRAAPREGPAHTSRSSRLPRRDCAPGAALPHALIYMPDFFAKSKQNRTKREQFFVM
jgi:hypothetical protein